MLYAIRLKYREILHNIEQFPNLAQSIASDPDSAKLV